MNFYHAIYLNFKFTVVEIQYRPVIRKPDIRKSGYKKWAGRVPAELLFVIT
jgi:hypothetical protein